MFRRCHYLDHDIINDLEKHFIDKDDTNTKHVLQLLFFFAPIKHFLNDKVISLMSFSILQAAWFNIQH